MDTGKKRNIAIRMGSDKSCGMHPPKGLTPAFWYRAMVSCCFLAGSASLNFSFSSSISGLSTRILAMLL